MNDALDTRPGTVAPGYGIGALGLAGAAVVVAAALTAVMALPPSYPFVLAVTLTVVGVVGGGAFAFIRERATWPKIVACGFVAGAIVPAMIVLLLPAPDSASVDGVETVAQGEYTFAGWVENLTFISGFGLVGVAGALVAWGFIHWLLKGGLKAKAGVGALVVTGLVAIWAVPWAAQDRSCHNTLRDGGDSISPIAEIKLRATIEEWRALKSELDRFAAERGWQVQSDVLTDPGFPWFQVSLCREPGTNIFVTTAAFEKDQMSISVFQPQGGDSWQAPLRELQDRLERRWPGRVGYGYGEFSMPRPPWAPPSPQPSDAPLRAREKSL